MQDVTHADFQMLLPRFRVKGGSVCSCVRNPQCTLTLIRFLVCSKFTLQSEEYSNYKSVQNESGQFVSVVLMPTILLQCDAQRKQIVGETAHKSLGNKHQKNSFKS